MKRVQDARFYGHERLEELIEAALRQLAELGIEVPRRA